jgi:hypothetical protein
MAIFDVGRRFANSDALLPGGVIDSRQWRGLKIFHFRARQIANWDLTWYNYA